MLPLFYNPFTSKLDLVNSISSEDLVVPVEFRVSNGYLQWRIIGSDEWINLISVDQIGGDGPDEAILPLIYDKETKIISINQATSLADGYMLAIDKAKIDNLSTVALTGSYSDLRYKPTLGTAASLDVPDTGNASTSQVVKGNDTRIVNAIIPFIYTQVSPSSLWTINHNFGYRPSVVITDSGSQEIDSDISHPTVNQTLISFNPATAGTARLT
jgi:hypothetical protein